MSTRDTLVRNTFWYGAVTAVGLISGLVMSVILARGLGPARMGDFSYLLWAFRTMTALATLGFALATTRYTADALGRGERDLAAGFLGFFLRRQLVSTTLVALALAPLILWLSPPGLVLPFLVLAVALFPATLEAIYAGAAYGSQRYDLTAQASTVKMVLQLTTAALALAVGADILGLVVGGTLATVASCAIQRRRARALYPAHGAAVPPDARAELRAYVVPLSVVVVLDMLVWDRSEVFFLRLHASSEEIAFYSLAFGLATRGMIVATVAAGPLLPTFATLHGRGAREELARVYRAAVRWVALVGAAIAAVGAALAPGVIALLYGAPYAPVGVLLGPMLGFALVGVLRNVGQAALRAGGDRRWALHGTWVSAALNVGAAAVLIPPYGVWGALVANGLAQIVASALTFTGVARREGCRLPVLDLARIAVAGIAAGLAARAVAGESAALPVLAAAGATGAIVFALAAVALGALRASDWRLAASFLRRAPRRPLLAGLGATAGALLIALYGPTVVALVRVWATDPHYSYGFLVPLFSGWLVWEARRRLPPRRPEVSAAGIALLVAGLAALVAGVGAGSLSLRAVSLPVVLAGLARLLVGRHAMAALAFPLAFLAFLAPLPAGTIPAISPHLQSLAAWSAGGALPAFGVPSVRDGLLIHIPGLTLEVTEACNGVRFLLAMTVLGTAFAWLTQPRLSRRLAVLGLAVAVAIVANLVRVAGTGVLAHYWGPDAAMGFFHVAYGKVVYLAMMVPFVVGVMALRPRSPGSRDAR